MGSMPWGRPVQVGETAITPSLALSERERGVADSTGWRGKSLSH